MKKLLFEKFQGNGNDFIIIDCRNSYSFKEIINDKRFSLKGLCNRQLGVGSDGVIFVMNPKEGNDVKMRIFNSDGSEAEMCGNGIRCLVEYLYKSNFNNQNKSNILKIETNAGLKVAEYNTEGISVKMGKPILENKLIPTTMHNKINNLCKEEFNSGTFSSIGYSVGMGNPHLIFFVDDLDVINLFELGPIFETNSFFPENTNVHFAKILNKQNIKVKVWERGAGATLACGTGACAVHVAAFLLGLCNSKTTISLPGGDLYIEWLNNEEEVKMTGMAEKVFNGEIII